MAGQLTVHLCSLHYVRLFEEAKDLNFLLKEECFEAGNVLASGYLICIVSNHLNTY